MGTRRSRREFSHNSRQLAQAPLLDLAVSPARVLCVYPGGIKLPPVAANLDLPAPTATGSFARTPLPHLLVYAHDRELTGTFEFAGPEGPVAIVLFIEGQPTKARTPDAQIYLGRILFELGILGEEQLEALLPRLLEGTELHGQVLIAEGLITEEQLELGLRAQLVRQMKWLVHLPQETTYAYYDSFDGLASYGGDGHVGIDPFPVVWAGIRDAPPWEHVHLGLTSLGTARIRLTSLADTLRFSFDKSERATLELLRHDALRVYDLTEAETMAPRLVQLLVYCLLVTKQVEVVTEAKSIAPVEEEAPISEAPPSSPFPGRLANAGPMSPQKVARVQLAQRAQARPNAAIEESTEGMAPEGADGRTSYVATQPRTGKKRITLNNELTAQAASSEPLAAPPVEAAQATGPAQIPTPSVGMAAIAELVTSTLATGPQEAPTVPKLAALGPEQIAAHVAATEARAASPRPPEASPPSSGARPLVAAARQAPPLPSRDKATLETKSAPISTKEEDHRGNAPPSSLPPTLPLAQAAPMSAELLARKKEIQDKAAAIDKEDYFTLLGVARDTPTAEVQKAFFGLAKKWHPDRVPAALADVKDLCAKVFGRMSEAHQTLMDAGKRAKYEVSIKAGGGASGDDSPEAQAQVMAILEAATNFQKAEICLKRNDTKQAEEFCTKAIAVEPKQADYIAMMAWLQSLKPQKQDPASTQQQIAELTRAIGISQACERAFFYRAMLLKRAGQEGQAVKDFKRAMDLNPRNVDAQREVRLYNMRGGDKAKPSNAPGSKGKDEGGGIFGKLFKK
jgi:curved DNA-binding protein CbpA